MPKVGIGGSPHNVFAVTNKVYVYAKKAAELGVKDGSYLRIRKAAVEVIPVKCWCFLHATAFAVA